MKKFLSETKSAGLSTAQFNVLQALVLKDQAWIEDGQGQSIAAAQDYAKIVDQYGFDIGQIYPDAYKEILDVTAHQFQKNKQYDQALAYFQKDVEIYPKNVYAWAHLGFLYMQRHDDANQTNAYHKAADLGDAWAQNEWGQDLWFGRYGVTKDRTEAIKYFTLAADKDFPAAKTNLMWASQQHGGS